MLEVEFHIFAQRREGLLREVGDMLVASGFKLVKQRMEPAEQGVELRLLLRGPEARVLDLEDHIACHPRVLSYESIHHDGITPAPVSHSASHANGAAAIEPAVHQVEAVLSSIAKDYPRIFPRLIGLRRALSEPSQASTLRYAGLRVGVWAYKRDYALGARLTFQDAVKNIAMPALKKLIAADWHDGRLRIESNPLCEPGRGGFNGDFFCGYLEGLLSEADVAERITVSELHCCSNGSPHCEFDIRSLQ